MVFPTTTNFPGSGPLGNAPQDALTAAGTTQATGLQLTGSMCTITSAAAGTGVNLPPGSAGAEVTVVNNGANAILVYATQGNSVDTINGIAGSQGVIVLPNSVGYFLCTTPVTGPTGLHAWTCSVTSPVAAAYNTNNSAVSFTATAANLSGSSADVVLDLTGNPAGAANVTLPTVAALQAALHGAAPNSTYWLRIKNSANTGTWTVVTNTGWTLTGTMTIATTTYRDFIVTFTSLTTAVLQNVGGGTA
jgi:hypothetical protein